MLYEVITRKGIDAAILPKNIIDDLVMFVLVKLVLTITQIDRPILPPIANKAPYILNAKSLKGFISTTIPNNTKNATISSYNLALFFKTILLIKIVHRNNFV